MTLQAALLAQHSASVVAETFLGSRLGEQDGRVFGALTIGSGPAKEVIDRSFSN